MDQIQSQLIRPRYRHTIKGSRVAVKSVQYIVFLVLSVFFLFPFILMFCTSFLNDKESLMKVLFSPTNTIYLGAYRRILSNANYLGYLKNTIFVSILSAFGASVSASLCAYGFSKIRFRGKSIAFGAMMASLMLPGIVTQVPLYTVYIKLGWAETLYPLWVPSCFGGGATTIFLMIQFMRGIPDDLLNAAKLDGANSFLIFVRMMLPLCVPIFLFMTVNAFIGSWNDFMTPLMYITDRSKWTLSLGIFNDYGGEIGPNKMPNVTMAAGTIMLLPCLILFFFFQRYLIEGVSVTGMKG